MTRDQIRAFFRGHGGRATLRELYREAIDQLLDGEIRAINLGLEGLVKRGELVEEPDGAYHLVEMPKGTGRKSQRTPALWRGVHQLSLRGPWSTEDLAQVSGAHRRSARMFVAAMIQLGHVQQVKPARYLVAKNAPHRDSPPKFKWPSGDKKYWRNKGVTHESGD